MSNPMGGVSPGQTAGVTENMIRDLVHTFYARVRRDDLLGPIFNAKVTDWDAHHEKICAFWSSVLLMTGRYKGRPMPMHARIENIAAMHFDRWLALFEETVRESCPSPAAELFIDRAHRIGKSLEFGVAASRGQILAPGERLGATVNDKEQATN